MKQQRDELALKIHLGRAEAKEEWERVTAQLDELMKDYDPLKQAVDESAENVFATMKLVAGEIEQGFERFRKHFCQGPSLCLDLRYFTPLLINLRFLGGGPANPRANSSIRVLLLNQVVSVPVFELRQ